MKYNREKYDEDTRLILIGILVDEIEKEYGYSVTGVYDKITNRMMKCLKDRGHKMFDKFADEQLEDGNYEKEYEEFWKDIVERDGVLDKEQVKKELYDYSILLHEVPKVYCHVTKGRISKPNTLACEVTSEADAVFSEDLDEAMKEYEENFEENKKERAE